ncbi:MAG TPA: GNAT family N-acetyltransferase [Ramlibacter sp.]|uniref:GNAT family N-acetyltransferase n=1 Tax=Ramlibacter sp. TaxID=1917967 RepID=UPI002D32A403|nr:GNAT family N-acetyltransferase [Ramlibacter sp.]HZY18889.1 GNAT family N-acetyltransferase [Ramlibacter sp.]
MQPVSFRPGEHADAVKIAALSVHVFLDTYATEGVRSDLAREAFHEYSERAFLARLSDPRRRFILAEAHAGLVGFAELEIRRQAPVPGLTGCELVRLYVQPRSQRCGVGSSLLRRAEEMAQEGNTPVLWLSVWEGNARALAFYAAMGYAVMGASTYALEGREYGNQVVAKRLRAV